MTRLRKIRLRELNRQAHHRELERLLFVSLRQRRRKPSRPGASAPSRDSVTS